MIKRRVVLLAACLLTFVSEVQSVAEPAIQELVSDLASAWNRGDAVVFAKRFRSDGTFTNVNGTTFEGHAAFEQRHRELFTGPLKGSVTTMIARRAQLIRPDVALVDVDCSTKVGAAPPIQSKLLLVLSREHGAWSIAAFHNTAVQAAPIVR
jgi:uncharacterized protein (TIGR02246 family)